MAPVRTTSKIAELARNFIDTISSEGQKGWLERISEVVSTRKSTGLLELVEELGTYLTSVEVQQRRKASRLLAELMHRLETNFLSDKESDLLTLFFIDRLKDHHSIQPHVIYGLLGLVSYFSVTDQNIISICQAIFAEVHVRSLVQADRRNIFNLFSNMLQKYIRPVHRMGADFVLGFIQSMDGEKDPRNLLVCFQNVQEIVSKLPFEVFAEDLFEVTSCYFPIDFTPPQSDPYRISKDDLVVQLRKCLASTHLFAPFCLPLLLEKITSDIVDAKIDAYLTLAECAKVYLPEDFCDYYKDLWSAVRRDYLLGGTIAIESACLNALEGTATCLSSKHDICQDYIETVLYDCEEALKDPDLNLHSQLSKIIIAIVYSCGDVFQMTFSRIAKLLGSLMSESQSNIKSNALVQILHQLLQHPFLDTQDVPLLSTAFASEQSTIAYLLASLSCPDAPSSLTCNSFECLLVLLFHGCLSESDALLYFDRLMDRFNSVTEKAILNTLIKCISFIHQRNLEPSPEYISGRLHLNIKNATYEQSSGAGVNVVKLKGNLEALYSTLQNTDNIVSMASKLIGNIPLVDLVCIHLEILKFFMQIFDNFPQAADKLESTFIPMLLQIIEEHKCEDEIWHATVALLRTLISNLSHQMQDLWINQLVSKFVLEKERLDGLMIPYAKKLCFVSSFICSARGSVGLLRLQEVLLWLQKKVLEINDSASVEYACKCYASLLNKLPEGEASKQCVDNALEYIDKILSNEGISVEVRESGTLLLLWVSKAAVLKWHPCSQLLLTKLVSLIPNEKIGRYICDNMFVLVREYDDCLNAKMHASKKIMYKQRLVDFVLPKLVELHKKGNEVAKSSISKAISCLFQQLPKQVVQKQLVPLIPLLIHSLSMSDVSVLSSTLSTFNSLENPAVLKNHVTSLIPRLLLLAKAPESMNVRIEAISCLQCLSNLPVHSVYPYQKNVIKSLKSCLDDKKRLVRREAYKCRNQWYLLSLDE